MTLESAIISVNGKVMGDLDDLVKEPTAEFKEAVRGLVERGMSATEPPEVAERAVQMGFDYKLIEEQYRDEVKQAAQVIRAQGHAMRTSILKIGRRLIEVKGMLPHGVFGEWIAAEFGMSERMSQNIMNVAREYEGKSETVSFLSDSVLYLLAAPSTPETARQAVEEMVRATGDVPTRRQVKRVIAEHRPAPTPAPSKRVYLGSEVEQPVMRLLTLDMRSDAFNALLLTASADQLLEALKRVPPASDKERYLKIGNRRELLMLARDAAQVDELIQAAMPTPLEQARPEGPREATETPAQELLATPDDLAARGYAIIPSQDGEQWRWKREDGFGGAVYGPPVSLEDAIAHVRKLIAIIEEFPPAMIKAGLEVIERNKAAPPPAPLPATMPPDLTVAGYTLIDTKPGPGWRWHFGHGKTFASGPSPEHNRGVAISPEAAIADARRHWERSGATLPKVTTAVITAESQAMTLSECLAAFELAKTASRRAVELQPSLRNAALDMQPGLRRLIEATRKAVSA